MKRGLLIGLLVLVVSTQCVHAQTSKQLKVEIGPNQQIWISATDVTYGEVLRALQDKLGCEIDIPASADDQKLSSVTVENKLPQEAFSELLAGSKMGFAFLGGNGSPITKIILTVSAEKEPSPGESGATGAIAPNAPPADASVPAPGLSSPSEQSQAEAIPQPAPPTKLSLADAANAIGVPPGVLPSSIGRQTTFSMADAASVMGVPPGLSPSEVGQTKVIPLSQAASVIGVAPGVSPENVGKTITIPLGSGTGPRP